MAGKSLGKFPNSVQGFGQVEQNEIYLENWSKVLSLYKAHDKLTMTCAFDWIHSKAQVIVILVLLMIIKIKICNRFHYHNSKFLDITVHYNQTYSCHELC